MAKHWLKRAKFEAEYYGYGSVWLPGSTIWREFMPDDLRNPARAITEAKRRGWLDGSGIPTLTRKGYLET